MLKVGSYRLPSVTPKRAGSRCANWHRASVLRLVDGQLRFHGLLSALLFVAPWDSVGFGLTNTQSSRVKMQVGGGCQLEQFVAQPAIFESHARLEQENLQEVRRWNVSLPNPVVAVEYGNHLVLANDG